MNGQFNTPCDAGVEASECVGEGSAIGASLKAAPADPASTNPTSAGRSRADPAAMHPVASHPTSARGASAAPASASPAEVRGATRRLLKALANSSGRLAGEGAAVIVAADEGERRLAMPPGLTRALVRADLLRIEASGSVTVTAAGLAWLRRSLAGSTDPFRAQQGSPAPATIEAPDGGSAAVLKTEDASPLARLAARRGRDGKPLIDAGQRTAGERLRSDFGFAQLGPRVTMDWSGFGGAGGGPSLGRGGAAELSDAVAAARERVRRALAALGPELADVALDVCCFEVGLEEIERARGWPVRSAKVVLVIALDRLAAHYGLAAEASGPAQARGIRAWGSEGFRPRA
jgi:hypothetical protein